MDPVSAIGLVGSILSLADIVTRSINRLSALKTKYRQADVSLSALIGTLYVLKAALQQLAEQHPSTDVLNAELDDALTYSLDGCRTIITTLEERLDQLEKRKSGRLTSKGKASLVWHDDDIKESLALLDRQVNALNLLLQAIQCKSLNEQRALMQEEDSITVLRLARECTASLYPLDDVGSEQGRWSTPSEHTSNLSFSFDFDRLILSSRPYQSATKHHIRKLTRRPQPDVGRDGSDSICSSTARNTRASGDQSMFTARESLGTSDATGAGHRPLVTDDSNSSSAWIARRGSKSAAVPARQRHRAVSSSLYTLPERPEIRAERARRTKTIDDELKRARKSAAREVKILMFSSDQDAESDLLGMFKLINSGGYTRDELESSKAAIFDTLVQRFRALLEAMSALEIPLDKVQNKPHAQEILTQSGERRYERLPANLASTVEALWADMGVQYCFTRGNEYMKPRMLKQLFYFASAVSRFADPAYVPTNQDVLMAQATSESLQKATLEETTFEVGQLTYRLFTVSNLTTALRKCIHVFDNVTSLLIMVDITCYTGSLLEDETMNRMQSCLERFDSLVNSRHFLGKAFIILFFNCDCLPTALCNNPPSDYFADYDGGDHPGNFQEYIRHRFISLRQFDDTEIYTHFIQSLLTDFSSFRRVQSSINDFIIRKALRRTKI